MSYRIPTAAVCPDLSVLFLVESLRGRCAKTYVGHRQDYKVRSPYVHEIAYCKYLSAVIKLRYWTKR